MTLVYVNSEWAGLADGTVVAGATIGYNGFATLDSGIAAVSEDGAVEVTGGSVSFATVCSKSIAVDAAATVIGRNTFDHAITINGTIAFDTAFATAETASSWSIMRS